MTHILFVIRGVTSECSLNMYSMFAGVVDVTNIYI